MLACLARVSGGGTKTFLKFVESLEEGEDMIFGFVDESGGKIRAVFHRVFRSGEKSNKFLTAESAYDSPHGMKNLGGSPRVPTRGGRLQLLPAFAHVLFGNDGNLEADSVVAAELFRKFRGRGKNDLHSDVGMEM